MRTGMMRTAAAIAALAGAGFALPAMAAVEGDATAVRSLGSSGFNPTAMPLPQECRMMPIVTGSLACPAGSTGTISTQSYYYCPTGSEPGLYSPAAVTTYGCVAIPAAVPDPAPIAVPVAPPAPPAAVVAGCVNRVFSYTLRRTGANTFEGRELYGSADTGWVAFTPATYPAYPNNPAKRIGRGDFKVGASSFSVTSSVPMGMGVYETLICYGSTP